DRYPNAGRRIEFGGYLTGGGNNGGEILYQGGAGGASRRMGLGRLRQMHKPALFDYLFKILTLHGPSLRRSHRCFIRLQNLTNRCLDRLVKFDTNPVGASVAQSWSGA